MLYQLALQAEVNLVKAIALCEKFRMMLPPPHPASDALRDN